MAIPATCAKKRYSSNGITTAQIMATIGWRVWNRKAQAANTSIAVHTIPRRGNATMVKHIMRASAAKRSQAPFFAALLLGSGGVSSLRHPTMMSPNAVNPVSVVKT